MMRSGFLLVLFPALMVIICLWLFVRHQRKLRFRAWLMREAVRNRDFSFRLRSRGLFSGERAMQEAMNEIGRDMGQMLVQNESEAWQRLMRVLTHEIMNSVTPICSISQSLMSDTQIHGTVYEEGLSSIYKTCVGLTAFVENFRKVSSIQDPMRTEVNLLALARSIEVSYPDVMWHINIPADMCLHADERMLRQVLINLVRNAVDAGAKDVDLRWSDALYVSNNGARIPADVAREIFIPFFTTKRNGSGIGLSLSRHMLLKQGMNLMLADIHVPGYHVTFCICPQYSSNL